MDERVCILGMDPLGTALGVLLVRADLPIAGIFDPDHARALRAALYTGCSAYLNPLEPVSRSRFVLFSGPPEPELLEQIRPALHPETVVGHTCVSLGPEFSGAPLGLGLHPVQAVPDAEAGVDLLPGSLFLLEGSPEAVARGAALVRALGGVPCPATFVDRPRAVEALALATGVLPRLLQLCRDLLAASGIEHPDRALRPLLEGVLSNHLRNSSPEGELLPGLVEKLFELFRQAE